MASSSSSVELGFVENRAAWKLRSKFFPSKVGGSPAWLKLDNLPDRSKLLCSSCNQPLVFLMQVYAPIHEIESAFHRTLFVFICTNGKCSEGSSNKNLVVLRNQLARKNNFYSFQPPDYNEKTSSDPSAGKFQTLCRICSLPASLKCPKCNEKNYCCEDHRAKDWEWNHKVECEGDGQDGTKRKKIANNFLLPEYELVTETEELPVSAPEKSDAEKMKEFDMFMKSDNAPKEMQDVPMEELDEIAKRKDKAFNKFQKRIKIEPEQVLRYQRGGTPLWVSSENVPTVKDIPNCNCGSKRTFEFQIMPQLLNHVKLDSVQMLKDGKWELQSSSIDWGTLAIYTCSKSCRTGTENYAKEFIWKQDFSKETVE